MAGTPYPKLVRRLPTVLNQEEVAHFINVAPNPFYHMLLMTLYATGARCAEVARLKVGDIDSQRMDVHIPCGPPFWLTQGDFQHLCWPLLMPRIASKTGSCTME